MNRRTTLAMPAAHAVIAVTLTVALYAPIATAGVTDLQKDTAACEQYVNERMQQDREARVTSRVVTTGANVLGSLLGYGNARAAAGSAVRMQGYSIANDVRMDATQRQSYMRQCLNEQKLRR